MGKAISNINLSVLAVVVGALSVASPAQAANYNGDLMIGVTVGSGKDLMYDLGPASSVTDGATWNLSSLLSGYSLATAHWGVVGNTLNGTGKNTDNTVYTTTSGSSVTPAVPSTTAYGNLNSDMGSMYVEFSAAGAGNYLFITFNDASGFSWYDQTVSPSTPVQYLNVYENPNVIGITSAALWAVDDYTTKAATLLGSFSLSAGGVVTFTKGSPATPPVAGFTGTPTNGFAPLQVVFTDTSTGSITNWLWNFGDASTMTNSTGGNATHTYGVPGNYTVTLTVTGAGGASTNTHTGYVVASPTPAFGSAKLSSGNLVLGGTDCPPGVRYRILTSTNLALPVAEWVPVVTSTFLSDGSYSYSCPATNRVSFFKLVSP